MSDYFDKDGASLDAGDWAAKFSDRNYQRVERDVLDDGKVVSTVWLGLDHSFGDEDKPVIFETMIFANEDDFEDLYVDRYSTLAEAKAGHVKAIEAAAKL